MNFSEIFRDLHQKYPARNPGSGELKEVIRQTKEAAATYGLTMEAKEIPVYAARTALLFFSLISCAAFLLGLAIPWAGFVGQLIISIILFREVVSPVLSRLKPGSSTNLTLKIPARSKETQRIYLVTALSTDRFAGLATEALAPWSISAIAVLPLLFQAFNWLGGWHPGLYLVLPVIAVGLLLALLQGKATPAGSLVNCAVLLELAAILSKSRAGTTTVSLIFTGARSLNSALLNIYPEFKQTELAYLINLTERSGKAITLATAEGSLIPRRTDPVLLDLIGAAAQRKNIAVAKGPLPEINETYPFKLLGRQAVTVANPLLENSQRDLRELLSGLIRLVDHPQE